jgi:hypothetical protein
MLPWITLAWSLTFGYLPIDSTVIVEQNRPGYASVITNNAISSKMESSLSFFDHARIFGSMETHETLNPSPSINGAFTPYEGYFRAGASIYGKFWEIGIVHECDHGIDGSDVIRPWLWAGYTQFFITLSGKVSF